MRFLKFIQSIVILGFLFAIHIIKYIFAKQIDSKNFIKRFESDNINVIGAEKLDILYETSNCICCNMCSVVNRDVQGYDGAEICASLSRDPTQFNSLIVSLNYNVEDCPYRLKVEKVSKLIS